MCGYDFIVVHHEFDNSFVTMLDPVLRWTDQVLKEHRDRRAILTGHSLMCDGVYCRGTLYDDFSTQGQLTYDALKHNENLFLMVCGHAGTSEQQPRRSDTSDGHTVHTMLACYQRYKDCPFRCGNGWRRILTCTTGFAAALDYNARLLGRFAGLLDEVRIWERALSAEEILRNKHAQVERAPGLIGRWSLDEVEGIVFDDSTGNEHWGGVHAARIEPWDVADLEGGVCVHLTPDRTD